MKIDKKQLKIARNYSDALLKIGIDQNDAEKLYTQLGDATYIVNTSVDLKQFLENPLISPNDKKEIIYKIFGESFDFQIINLLNLLADNKRLKLLETVYYCYEKDYEKYRGISRVEIISAVEMNKESKVRLNKTLKAKLGNNIIPEYKIDFDIIGGLIIKIQDKIIDLSLNKRIKDMEKQLT